MDRRTPQAFRGTWRIEEMEVWGSDYLDLVVPAHLTFDDESIGSFQFGTVAGGLDCRFDESGAKERGSSRPGCSSPGRARMTTTQDVAAALRS